MNVEDLRLDADVVSSDGHKLGTLSRFVFHKDTLMLTHIVVDTGIFRREEALWKGGWGMSNDRMLPIGVIDREDSDKIHISMTAEEFRDLSVDFAEEYFTRAPDVKPGWLDASDLARLAMSIPGEPGPYLMQQKTALAPDEVDVPAGAAVWRLRPHQKIGEVERVIYDEATRKITGLVIRRGFLFTKERILPASCIVEVVAGVVRVEVDDAHLDALIEFHAAD